MATTSNGLRYPISTDTFDLAQDIKNLAEDADGVIGTLPINTKGDILTHDGTNEVRLAIGATNGHALVADSATTTGLKYASVSATQGSLEHIADVRVTGSSSTALSVASIPGTFTDLRISLFIKFLAPTVATFDTPLIVTINGTNVQFLSSYWNLTGTFGGGNLVSETTGIQFTSKILTASNTANNLAISGSVYELYIPNYSNTTRKKQILADYFSQTTDSPSSSSPRFSTGWAGGLYDSTSAVTSISFSESTGATILPNSYCIVSGIKRLGA